MVPAPDSACDPTIADLRVVERQAKFSTAFSQRGLIAEHE